MSAPRKRTPTPLATSGFKVESVEETPSAPEKEEQELLEEFIEVASNEVFEAIELAEEKVEKKVEVKTFVEQSIVPSEDLGPRFVETQELPVVAKATPPTPIGKAPPKRHPRNTPKFSRTAK